MKCPSCGGGTRARHPRYRVHLQRRNDHYSGCAGRVLPGMRGKRSRRGESKRVSAAMLEFNKQVNASIVDPAFIARVRKKLALDQRQAAAIFGGGANAFSRYENGKTKPPLALVKLLMVLDRHPNLLNELRAGQ